MAELTEAALRRAQRDAGLPEAPVRYHAVTGSTNATALAWARDGAPEWTLVAAGHQSAGRGRLGRTWESTPGEALLFSVVLRPTLPPEQAALLTLLAGTAMSRACADVAGLDVRCKWPNDLLVGDAKVGGILAEASVAEGRIEHVVLGVGVNLGRPPDVEGAGALGDVDPAELLSSFLAELARVDSHERGFARRIVRDYRTRCATLGRRVRATTTEGRTVEGTATQVGDDGSLLVETDGGPERVAFGEVLHLR